MSDPTRREWRFYLDDMIAFAEKVIVYTQGLDQAGFVGSGLNYDATVRHLELIGEAATHLPDEIHRANPQIPWRLIVATRNRLIHGYPMLIAIDKTNAVRSLLANPLVGKDGQITNVVRRHLMRYAISGTASRKSTSQPAAGDASVVSWQPGSLNPGLSWNHYRRLLRVATIKERSMVVPKATP